MDIFHVAIKFVPSLPQGDCGYCVTRNKRKTNYEIAISHKAHKKLSAFGATMLHELLHLWIYLMGVYGYRVSLKAEHKFIYAVENTVIQFMEILKRGEKHG